MNKRDFIKEVMSGTTETAQEYGIPHKGPAALAALNAYIWELHIKYGGMMNGVEPNEAQKKEIRDLLEIKNTLANDLSHTYRLEALVSIHEHKIMEQFTELVMLRKEVEVLREMNKF